MSAAPDSGCAVVAWTVYGEPLPQPRPRVYRRRAMPDAAHIRDLKLTHLEAARAALPLEWPVSGQGTFVVSITVYRSNRRRCDVDNLAKLVLDAVKDVVWDDDHRVRVLRVEKRFDALDPRTEVEVYVESEAGGK